MILPIYLYGQNELRNPTQEIPADYPDLQTLIDNMFDTMRQADGVGLAAPQIGLDIRLFVVDLTALGDENPEYATFKEVFINPLITERSLETVQAQEGCLSIPGINEIVERNRRVTLHWFDRNFVEHTRVFSDFAARSIQHEYDHLEGVLFTDKLSPIKKQLVKSKLTGILKGKASCKYKIKTSRK